MAESVLLRVAKAQSQTEVGLGRARLDMKTRKELGVAVGQIVEITGKKMTVAKVFRAQQEDEGKDIIRIDGVLRSNAGVSIGERVTVTRADPQLASKVVLAPAISQKKRVSTVSFGPGTDELVRKGLLGRPLVKGDEIMIPNMAWGMSPAPYMVASTVPSGVVTRSCSPGVTTKPG